MDQHKWNELADGFDEGVFNIVRTDLTGMVARYVQSVPASRDSSVLVDLGCGTGSFIKKFGHRFHEIVGVEFAAKIIARAKKSLGTTGKIDWLNMDLSQAAKIIGPRADLTTCLNVVTSPSAAQRRRMWTGIARTLKPRGYALIVVPSLESEMMLHEVGGAAKPSKTGIVHIDDEASQKFYRRDELIADLARHGLKTRRTGRVFYPWREEGMRKPRGSGKSYPWGWICLAQRAA